jgi:hypothetical protein
MKKMLDILVVLSVAVLLWDDAAEEELHEVG